MSMRTLILGAGGTGGYFGGRLAAAGADVGFLLRPASAERLRRDGLAIRSVRGDLQLPVRVLTRDALDGPYDLILLSCKAYDLAGAIDDIAPAVGPGTRILPLLNGLAHLDRLDARFGRARVLGGLCNISAGRGPAGEVVHLNRYDELVFGARRPADAALDAVGAELRRGHFRSIAGDDIELAIWEKFVFIATLASVTCAMRGDIGSILATGPGERLIRGTLAECQAVAAAHGYPVRAAADKLATRAFTERGSTFTASMLRDIQAGSCTEAEHIVGDMVARAEAAGVPVPHLQFALCHLQVYEGQLAAA
jgi:2-dehydropantoate 2-reductase